MAGVRYQPYRPGQMAAGRRGFDWRYAAPVAGIAAMPALGAIGAGSAGGASASLPAAATHGIGFSAAPAVGGGMTLGNIFNLANLGVGSVSSYMGQRANNRALSQQMTMQEREMQMRAAADADARAEARRQFDAQQANEQRRLAAEDDDRAFSRRLVEERESRLAPYRAQADLARRRLAAFLGLR